VESCSLCGAAKADVKWLVAGDTATICDACIGRCNDLLVEGAPTWKYGTPYPLAPVRWPGRRCSFCAAQQAAKLIGSMRGVHICEVCVVAANDRLIADLKQIDGALEDVSTRKP
jgi:ATP-dependent protease Clp ATPase subunit